MGLGYHRGQSPHLQWKKLRFGKVEICPKSCGFLMADSSLHSTEKKWDMTCSKKPCSCTVLLSLADTSGCNWEMFSSLHHLEMSAWVHWSSPHPAEWQFLLIKIWNWLSIKEIRVLDNPRLHQMQLFPSGGSAWICGMDKSRCCL